MIIFPLYLLLDVSGSMAGGPMAALNESVHEIIERLASYPVLADKVRVCIISFSGDARIEMPLSDPTTAQPPRLRAGGGGTNLASVLQLLLSTIEQDIRELKSERLIVYRPLAFFITDGYPTDDPSIWTAELERLQETLTHPTIIAVGIGGVDPAILRKLAGEKGQALISRLHSTPAEAMAGFTDLVFGTVDSLASSQSSGQHVWQVPKIQEFDTPPPDFFI